MKNCNLVLKISCHLSTNIIDWIRSIYFSLFGSSMLTFILKSNGLEDKIRLQFLIGVLLFFVGLFMSLIIANRFKNYEKVYDTKDESYRLNNTISKYYFDKESEKKNWLFFTFQHLLFICTWVPAFYFIYIAGSKMEEKTITSNKYIKNKLETIENNINILKSDLYTIDSIKDENLKLQNLNLEYENIIDSLIDK